MQYSIEIPNWHIPTDNKLKGHWTKGMRVKHGAMLVIHAHAAKVPVPRAEGKRRVEVVHTQGAGSFPDPTNLFKVLNDALKRLGLVIDDNAKWLESTIPHLLRGDKHTTIRITDL